MSRYEDVIYKMTDTHPLYFDLEVPEDVENPPLIMWIHGGGWKDLNRKWNLVSNMSGRGYAVASIDYRYSDEDCFPADIIDCKDALWYLRKHAAEYGYDPEKIIVHDFSAKVKDGQKIAIVGPTGAGKTTMVKLLMRFYDVNKRLRTPRNWH